MNNFFVYLLTKESCSDSKVENPISSNKCTSFLYYFRALNAISDFMINWGLKHPNMKSEFHSQDLYFLCSLKILPICYISWCPSNKVELQVLQTLQNSFYDDFIKQLVYICWTHELSICVEFNLWLKLKSICHRSNTQIFSFNIM